MQRTARSTCLHEEIKCYLKIEVKPPRRSCSLRQISNLCLADGKTPLTHLSPRKSIKFWMNHMKATGSALSIIWEVHTIARTEESKKKEWNIGAPGREEQGERETDSLFLLKGPWILFFCSRTTDFYTRSRGRDSFAVWLMCRGLRGWVMTSAIGNFEVESGKDEKIDQQGNMRGCSNLSHSKHRKYDVSESIEETPAVSGMRRDSLFQHITAVTTKL